MLHKTRYVAGYPNVLHRFPLLGTTTEKTCGCPINFTLKIMFRNDERFCKSPQSSRPIIAGCPKLIMMTQAHSSQGLLLILSLQLLYRCHGTKANLCPARSQHCKRMASINFTTNIICCDRSPWKVVII